MMFVNLRVSSREISSIPVVIIERASAPAVGRDLVFSTASLLPATKQSSSAPQTAFAVRTTLKKLRLASHAADSKHIDAL
jgi:hypothetical protein